MHIPPARLWRYNQERRKYLGKRGVLLGWSVIRVGPEGLSHRTPYAVGLVQTGSEKIITQLTEVREANLRKGMRMVGRLRRLFEVPDDQLVVYGVKFAPEGDND